MRFRLLCAAAFAIAAAVVLVGAAGAPRAQAAGSGQSLCIGHHPQDYVWYTGSCTGHDEPEIDPLSNAHGSAQDLTWTVVLPTDAAGTTEAQAGQRRPSSSSATETQRSCESRPFATRVARAKWSPRCTGISSSREVA